MENLMEALMQIILQVVGVVVASLIGWVAVTAKKKYDLEISTELKDMLHSGLTTGILMALRKGLSGNAAIAAALDHARISIPETIAKSKATTDVMINIAEAKLEAATSNKEAATVAFEAGKKIGEAIKEAR